MAKSKSAEQVDFPAMETPRDEELEAAAIKYKRTIQSRMKIQDREATEKAKVGELVHLWADLNKIKPVIVTSPSGVQEEALIYSRADIRAVISRPLKENVKVLLGEEVPEPPAPAAEGDA